MSEDKLKPCPVCENDKHLIIANENTPIGIVSTVTCPACITSATRDNWNNIIRAKDVAEGIKGLVETIDVIRTQSCECAQILGDAMGKPIAKPQEGDDMLFLTLAKEAGPLIGKMMDQLFNEDNDQ